MNKLKGKELYLEMGKAIASGNSERVVELKKIVAENLQERGNIEIAGLGWVKKERLTQAVMRKLITRAEGRYLITKTNIETGSLLKWLSGDSDSYKRIDIEKVDNLDSALNV